MSWSARICREAVGYARIGWPVAPGARAIGRPRRWQWLINPDARTPTPACSCGDRDCPAPAAHPADRNPQPLTDPDAVRAVWAAPDPPNIVLACGAGFDVIQVSGQVAAETEKILAAWRLNPAIALTATPVVRRLLFVAPGPPVPLPAGARYLGAGRWVPAPPSSRGPAGEDRWFWPYDTRWRQLPPAGEVAEAVTLADQQVRGCMMGPSVSDRVRYARQRRPSPVVGSWCFDCRDEPNTGLVCFPDFHQRLPGHVAAALAAGRSVGVAIGDVDGLTEYVVHANQIGSWGHQAGSSDRRTRHRPGTVGRALGRRSGVSDDPRTLRQRRGRYVDPDSEGVRCRPCAGPSVTGMSTSCACPVPVARRRPGRRPRHAARCRSWTPHSGGSSRRWPTCSDSDTARRIGRIRPPQPRISPTSPLGLLGRHARRLTRDIN